MNPRIEEVSDSDSDPPEMGLEDIPSLMDASHIPASSAMAQQMAQQMMLNPQSPAVQTSNDREKVKHYQCLYPLYFDKSRTRQEGRRVGAALAVENPLAREMADAAASLGLQPTLEPDKTHPRDWSNPGRIRVLLKQDGRSLHKNIKNKHHLYILMSQYLKENPTQKDTPLRLPIRGLPMPEDGVPEPAVPRGWKMNKILPLHSPAMSGGGVSENFLQQMMAEMQGDTSGAAGITASSGGEGKKKKDKKKK
ncbi:signal recognition particle, SRP19 subunit [Massariosphaeria phaeospora]|uniref:Signal recognition particle, SRP19 subunit n=1 Tax=Massariosphaeria phaeospora TaxID=100035 RepID=A0A7C8MIL1_9PLEO|nr:signal recognition particle, SRP19 subunit [Massariosphaeria phaeospora]